MSFSLHSGRFRVECKEFGNKLFSYFELSYACCRILLWIQGLQSICRVTQASSFTPALLILIWLSFEKIEKNNFISNPCFLNLS